MATIAPQQRYLHKPFAGSSHTWAVRILDRFPLQQSSAALDIGTGAGMFGQYLADRGVGVRIGIDIDEEARAHCAPFYSRLAPSLESLLSEPEAAYESMFDVVLMLDVLEHMAAPQDFFGRVIPLLKPGGLALISVPNIAHWTMRLSLLFGFFEYTNRGILDRTHLHFFTRRHFRSLWSTRSEVKVEELAVSISPIELMLPEFARHWVPLRWFAHLRRGAARVLPGLLGYQHLVALRRKA